MPSERERLEKRMAALENERRGYGWEAKWQSVADYVVPELAVFTPEDTKRLKSAADKIDNTAKRALQRFSSGMTAGLTSASRPWFRLTLPDQDLLVAGANRAWLHDTETRTRENFARSNLYKLFPTTYASLAAYGLGCVGMFEDIDTVFRFQFFKVGTYCLACDSAGRVNWFGRRTKIPVSSLVAKYGKENCSGKTLDLYNRGDYDTLVNVCSVIEENPEHNLGSVTPKYLPWRQWTWETDESIKVSKFLEVTGYHEFPILTPRYESVSAEDVYSISPIMRCLGDIQALELLQQWKLQGVELTVDPPMKGPAALQDQKPAVLPGARIYYDAPQGMQGYEPAMTVHPQFLPSVKDLIAEHQQRVSEFLFEDLFVALLTSDRRQITAREVEELHQEKFLMLGPVLGQVEDEFLGPMVNRAVAMQFRAGLLEEPPAAIANTDYDVEFISILASAQKRMDTYDIERQVQFTAALAALNPAAVDKLDVDAAQDEYARMSAVTPAIIRDAEKIAAMRAQRQQQENAARMAAMAQPAAQGAKAIQTLAETDVTDDSALQRLGAAAGAAVGQ